MLRKSPKYSNALTNITYNLFPQKTFQILISPFFLRYTNSLYFERSQKYHFLFTTLYFFISPRDLFAHFLVVILETPFKRYDLPTQISLSSLCSSIRDEGRSRTKKSRSLFPERVVEEKRGGGIKRLNGGAIVPQRIFVSTTLELVATCCSARLPRRLIANPGNPSLLCAHASSTSRFERAPKQWSG